MRTSCFSVSLSHSDASNANHKLSQSAYEAFTTTQKPSSGPAWGGAGLPRAAQTSETTKVSTEFPGLGEEPAKFPLDSSIAALAPIAPISEAADTKEPNAKLYTQPQVWLGLEK